jgi:DNA-binding response OmpR family regulator
VSRRPAEIFGMSAVGGGPDFVLLVLTVPKMQALEVWKEIHRDDSLKRLPVTMLVAHSDVPALAGGAQGMRPSRSTNCVGSVKDLFRLIPPAGEIDRLIEVGELLIDPSSYRVTRAGKPVTLTVLEFRLLYYLAARPNRLFTRDQLLTAIWGAGHLVKPRILDAYIRRLRVKLEADPQNPARLKTFRGVGYLFDSGDGNRMG